MRTLLALWLLPATAWGSCDNPTDQQALETSLSSAEQAFSELDLGSFTQATDAARAQWSCVRGDLPAPLIARAHRFEGLRRFADGDAEGAALAFAAARAIEPAYDFPTELVPPGNPVRTLYEGLDVEAPLTEWVPPPVEGHLRFDGQMGDARPSELPTVFQRFDGQGSNVDTAYVWPGDALPAYEARKALSPRVVRMVPWMVVTGVATAGAATFYGLAAAEDKRFFADDTPASDLATIQQRNHRFVRTSAVLGGVALGGATGLVVTGVF